MPVSIVRLARLPAAFLLLLAASCSDAPYGGATAAIFGGEASDNQAVLAIRGTNSTLDYTCSGTVIGDYAVLTARHCVAEGDQSTIPVPPSDLRLYAGNPEMRGVREILVDHVIVAAGEHGEYAFQGRDLAIIITAEHLGISPLPLVTSEVEVGAEVTMIGFGRRGGVVGSGERYEGITSVSDVVPAYRDDDLFYWGMFITQDGESSACSGDSGGPVLNAAGEIVGVIAGGTDCATGGLNQHMSVVANAGVIARALERIPGCQVADAAEGCAPMETTTLLSQALEATRGATIALVEGGDVVVGTDRDALVFREGTTGPQAIIWPSNPATRRVAVAADGLFLAVGSDDLLQIHERVADSYPMRTSVFYTGMTSAPKALAMRNQRVAAGVEGSYSEIDPSVDGAAFAALDFGEALLALDAPATPSLGSAVATNGDGVAIGARWADGVHPGEGRVHAYARVGDAWTEQTLSSPDPQAYDEFGTALAWEGTTLVVGAPRDDTLDGDAGAVYVFDSSDLGAAPMVLHPEPGAQYGALFGHSVALDGDRLVIGAPGEGAGAVYVFERRASGLFARAGRIEASAGAEARFGHAVDLDGDLVAVLAAPSFTNIRFERPPDVVALFEVTASCSGEPTPAPPCTPPPPPATDAGLPDAGAPDSGVPDSGATTSDAGGSDTGVGAPPDDGGCGCTVVGDDERDDVPWLALAFVAVLTGRVRRRLVSRG